MTKEELQSYKMTHDERDKWINIQDITRRYCKRSVHVEYNEIVERHISKSVYYEHYAGYCKDEGYYYINIGDRGEVYLSCKTESTEEILFYLMKSILHNIGIKLELSIRDIDQKKWMYYEDVSNTKPGKIAWVKNKEYIYHTQHDTRKWWFEYIIKNLWLFFNDAMIEPIVEEYTGYMNHWFEEKHWKYDREKKQFIEISDSVEIN